MRRRLVRGGLIGAAVIYGAAALMTGSSGAQVPPFPSIPDFTFPPFPTFTVPSIPSTTSPPPTMPPPTTSTTSPPPTMPPSTSPPTSSPPPTMPPTSLPSAPEISDVIEEIIDRFNEAADDVLSDFEEFQGLLQDL